MVWTSIVWQSMYAVMYTIDVSLLPGNGSHSIRSHECPSKTLDDLCRLHRSLVPFSVLIAHCPLRPLYVSVSLQRRFRSQSSTPHRSPRITTIPSRRRPRRLSTPDRTSVPQPQLVRCAQPPSLCSLSLILLRISYIQTHITSATAGSLTPHAIPYSTHPHTPNLAAKKMCKKTTCNTCRECLSLPFFFPSLTPAFSSFSSFFLFPSHPFLSLLAPPFSRTPIT